MKKFLMSSLILVGLTVGPNVLGSNNENSLLLVGLDESGNEIEKVVDGRFYKERMLPVMKMIEEDTVETVMSHNENSSNRFTLKTIEVGLGLTAALQLGTLVSAQAKPEFLLIFSR